MINLSPRLMTIASFVDKDKHIIDVGCDHCLLGIYLYQNNISHNITPSELNVKTLNNALKNIKKYNLERKIVSVISDGLTNIYVNNDNNVIISGMGTKTIIDILTKDKSKLEKIDKMIIQSNNNLCLLRKSIVKLGYIITKEKIVKDNNIYYTIIKFEKGKKFYMPRKLKYGPILIKDKEDIFCEYISHELTNKKRVLKTIPKNKIIKRIVLKINIRQLNKLKK